MALIGMNPFRKNSDEKNKRQEKTTSSSTNSSSSRASVQAISLTTILEDQSCRSWNEEDELQAALTQEAIAEEQERRERRNARRSSSKDGSSSSRNKHKISSTSSTSRSSSELSSDSECSEASESSQRHRKAKNPAVAYKLIDKDRKEAGASALSRSEELEKAAFRHAARMARAHKVNHSVKSLSDLQTKLNSRMVGENVQRGASIEAMHERAMANFEVNRNNVLGPDFTEYGIATIYGKDGQLYMCQYFR